MRVLKIVLGAQLALIAGAALAQAQSTLDVAKISCSDFLFDKIAPSKSIAVWLSGFYSGTQHNTVIDMGQLDRNIDKVEDYCRLHLDTKIMDATKAALGTGR